MRLTDGMGLGSLDSPPVEPGDDGMDSEPSSQRPLGHRIILTIRRMFLSGVLITVPVIVTVIVLNFLFTNVDGILSPFVERVFGYTVPGMGLAATILLIMLVGALGRNVAGSRLVGVGERVISRTPVARTIYGAAKQLVEAVTLPEHKQFNRVVAVEYPRRGIYAVGFATGRTCLSADGDDREMVAVFIPSTPTPVSGMVVLVPQSEVIELSIGTEEAIKFLVSGGLAVPARFTGAVRGVVEA
ncbi:MAG TPA: DUF502 domain-containing protein [Acidobacteriota bacterium]|nr:DUF502 domain-containing protein [Acidobacteriota bacterium]